MNGAGKNTAPAAPTPRKRKQPETPLQNGFKINGAANSGGKASASAMKKSDTAKKRPSNGFKAAESNTPTANGTQKKGTPPLIDLTGGDDDDDTATPPPEGVIVFKLPPKIPKKD